MSLYQLLPALREAGVSERTAIVVLNTFGEPNTHGAGSFTTHVIEAAIHADPFNRVKLGTAFPDIVAAVEAYKDDRDGAAALRIIAGLDQVEP